MGKLSFVCLGDAQLITVLSGQIIADFEEVNGHHWGMIQVAHESYEVTLLDVPEGAEALFLEDVEVTVRGRLQGKLSPTLPL